MKIAEINWGVEDIVGTNYMLDQQLAQHAQHPDRVLVSTESFPPLGEPQKVLGNSFVVGDFVWSAEDYLGEAGIGRWFYEGDPTEPLSSAEDGRSAPEPLDHGSDKLYPWHGAPCGLLDLLGNARPAAAFWNILWNRSDKA